MNTSSHLGAGGRRFKSGHPDLKNTVSASTAHHGRHHTSRRSGVLTVLAFAALVACWGTIDPQNTKANHVASATAETTITVLPSRPSRWTRALATWYGPGFYGNRTACGQRYTIKTRGTAHMTLPCGTKLTIRRGRRVVRVRVIDRGAFSHTFDLSARTAMDLCGCWRPYTMRVTWKRGWA